MLDNFDDLDIPEEDEVADSGGNRSFIMVAGGIGALIVVALLMMAAYIFFFLMPLNKQPMKLKLPNKRLPTLSINH